MQRAWRAAIGWMTIGVTVLMFPCAARAQTIVKAAQTEPDSGRRYALISASNWEAAQAWAQARGGSLATIKNAYEDSWVSSTFSPTASKYTIGLKVDSAGNYMWSGGNDTGYRNWAPGEPKLTATNRYVYVANQTWALCSTSYVPFYVVEWSAGPIRVPEEYPTIDEAMAAMASSGEMRLVVGPGAYTLGSTVTLTCPAGFVGSITGAGNDVTQITYNGGVGGLGLDGNWEIKDAKWARSGDSQLFFAKNGFTSFERLKIDGQNSSSFWALIQVDPTAQLTVTRSRIRRADAVFGTSGVTLVQVSDSVIEDSKIVSGYGIRGTYSNCTMVGVGYNGLSIFLSPTRIINSILWNTASRPGDAVLATNSNCDRFVLPGFGNFREYPGWDPVTYELREGSLCIDAGSTSAMVGSGLDMLGRPRVFGAAPDVGAFEFTRAQCEADFNGDGFITFEDFDEFVTAFEEGC